MLDGYLNQERFVELTSKFPQSNIAVIGDFFLDEYLILDKSLSEISVETGLEAFQVTGTRKNPGAAGTVTNILRSLEVPVVAIGFSGDDGHGFELRRGLKNLDVNLDHFAIFPDRMTPTYTKPMLLDRGCETEQSRLDAKNHQPLLAEQSHRLIHSLRAVVPEVNAILVVDQVKERNCGAITDAVRAEIANLAGKYPEKVFMADSREYMRFFKNTIVKFNVNEASKMVGFEHLDQSCELIDALSYRLFDHYHMPIILTLGADGLQVTDRSGSARIPAIHTSGPKDIVGAGDSVMAAIGAALSAGASLIEASMIGNITASIIVEQIGTTGIATRPQIKTRFDETNEWLNSRIRVSQAQFPVNQ
ncbi:MAG: PfkB family carbohydrate kinase [Anaerolineaceae bacterium]|nr:PfkB family carbohydrate kinase [Anaerolineaceae bacterium]